ncbi:unnamed protein product [Spirodela intermedia]|uniref:Uncharacterized protein n=1 Tax=Spirodela intermedia TaxID=51605 RepID=A0A7I8KAJ6_SPIIN|nr:unnamed protein product [Spirodela intermedia]
MVTCTRPITIPMNPNLKLSFDENDMLEDLRRYKRLVGKLKYLTITQLNISFATSVPMQAFSDVDCVGCNVDKRFITGYYIFLGDNLIS